MTENDAPVGRLLTMKEAADYLRVSRSTLYTIIGTGELRPVRIRGRRLFALTDLDKYARDQQESTAS